MSDYLLMLRFDIRKLINYIVEIRRTPKKLISYFLFLGWICLILIPQFKSNKKSSLALQMNPTTIHVILGIYNPVNQCTDFQHPIFLSKKVILYVQYGRCEFTFSFPA